MVKRFTLGEAPAWRPITSVDAVDALVREMMTRLALDDFDQARMDEYTPLIEQAERVRDILPWQRDWLEACRLLFEAEGPEEIAASEAVSEKAMQGIE